ncbi:MAG: hypothetical protein ACRELV_02035 [Longimicrobiales bacterium]
MDDRRDAETNVGSFWEQADRDGSGDNPYARELQDCIDAAHRYWRLYAQAEEAGRDIEAELLLGQYEETQARVTKLRSALRGHTPR